MAWTSEEFAFLIKQKYPQYRDVDNAELVQRVTAKYPQYRADIVDLAGQPQPGLPAEQPTHTMPDGSVMQGAAHPEPGVPMGKVRGQAPSSLLASQRIIGALKGLGRSAVGAVGAVSGAAGQLPGAGKPWISPEQFGSARESLAASSPGEQEGMAVEQAAEFFAGPGGPARSAARLAGREALRAGVVGAAQGGDVESGVVPALVGGGFAGAASKVARMAPWLKDKGARLLERSLRPAGKGMKREVARASEHALEQVGSEVSGTTPEEMQGLFGREYQDAQSLRTARVGTEAHRGTEIELMPVYRKIQALADRARRAGMEPDAAIKRALSEMEELFTTHGTRVTVPVTTQVPSKLLGLQGQPLTVPKTTMQTQVTPRSKVPIDVADTRRSELAQPLWKTGAAPATAETAGATKVASIQANLIRRQIARRFPDIAALGDEAHKFGTLRKAAETESIAARTREPMRMGEVLALRGGGMAAGGALGYESGGAPGAAAGLMVGYAAPMAVLRYISRPQTMTRSAYRLTQLSKLIEAGNVEQAGTLASRWLAEESSE